MIATATTPLQAVLDRLKSVKQERGGYVALCPAHADHRPSLAVSTGEDGRVLLACRAGCTTAAVVDALGLRMADLFPAKVEAAKVRRREVASYCYTTATGELLYEVVRFAPKTFQQRRPDGAGGWAWDMVGVRRVLYRLPDIAEAGADAFIFFVEGEKDADALARLGFVATTTSGGAGKAHLSDLTPLHGRHVILLPDNDDPGRAHMADVAARLHGKAASVRVLELPGLPPKGDASDWLDAGGDPEDLCRMAEAAPTWTPPAEPLPATGEDAKGYASAPILVRLADVSPEPVKWLWPGRIARGKLTMFAGEPGVSKSFLTLDLAARISTGAPWPDMPGERNAPAGVVLLNAEDDIGDTVRPRLDAAGADCARITAIQGVTHRGDNGAEVAASWALGDIEALEGAIASTPDCALVVIDPHQPTWQAQIPTLTPR